MSYEIYFGHVSDDLCRGVGNESTLFDTSETQHLNYGWTSSLLYSYYHPAELNRLQPQLIFQILKRVEFEPEDDGRRIATAITWDGNFQITTAQVFLHVPSLPCSPTYDEVYNSLWDFTSLVSWTVRRALNRSRVAQRANNYSEAPYGELSLCMQAQINNTALVFYDASE